MDCCKYCRNRTAGCHVDCIKYIVQKEEFNEEQRKIKEKRYVDSAVRQVRNDGIRRMMRKD